MALNMSERQALEILTNRVRKDGEAGLINFAREVLGAHSAQAKRLAYLAVDVVDGKHSMDALPENSISAPEDEEPIQVSREIDGQVLNVTLKSGKLPITTYEELVEFYEIDTDVWEPTAQSFNFWGSDSRPNFQIKAHFSKKTPQSMEAAREEFREWAKEFAGNFESPPYLSPLLSPNMGEIILSDLHWDKANTGTSTEEFTEKVYRAVEEVLDGLARQGSLEEVNLVLLGDTFHADTPDGKTTRGTQQEVDPNWRKSFEAVRGAIASIAVELAEYIPRVHIRIIPGNHDTVKTFFLIDSLWSYFHNHPRVSVALEDVGRQYIHWGVNLIGLNHGDKVKPIDLVMSMFHEADTSQAEHMEWHLGHYHTRRVEEVHGVTVRSFQSAREPGNWDITHAHNHNKREIVGILWHSSEGPVVEVRRQV